MPAQVMTTSKALVFDIKRFAIHDGEGLRTTIFLKGCPLRCRWCQNPEGLDVQRAPMYMSSRCIHCQLCARFIQYQDRPLLEEGEAMDLAIADCPAEALRYDSTYYSVEELIEKIKEDAPFYKYGGGVTFSGGEPLLQWRVLVSLLKECQKAGIHTAIESSLYSTHLQDVMPHLDFIYCDLKLYDAQKHLQATGVDHALILENIKTLLHSPMRERLIVRTPLIPGYTATDENIAAIAQFLVNEYPDVTYELLNYNPLASAKYEWTSFTYGLDPKTKALRQEEMEHFRLIVRKQGLKNVL